MHPHHGQIPQATNGRDAENMQQVKENRENRVRLMLIAIDPYGECFVYTMPMSTTFIALIGFSQDTFMGAARSVQTDTLCHDSRALRCV